MALRERRKQNRTGDTTETPGVIPELSKDLEHYRNPVSSERLDKFVEGISKDKQLDKAHKKLDKIENNCARANKQLEKHKKKQAKKKQTAEATESPQPTNDVTTASPSSTNRVHTKNQQDNNKNLRMASWMEFLMQKGLPKQITRFIASRAFFSGDTWICVFHSSDFLDEYNLEKKKIRQLSNAIDRMKKSGWFEIIDSSQSGVRTFKIKPENYGLKAEDELEYILGNNKPPTQ